MIALRQFELQILDFFQANVKNGFFDAVMPAISRIGNFGIIWLMVALVLIITKKYRFYGIVSIIALTAGFLIGNILLKNIVDRSRPFFFDSSVSLLINQPTDASFPSGHTLSSFAAMSVLMFANRRMLGVPALCVAVLIAFSRMYLFVHFPTDILVGATIGVGIGILSVVLARKVVLNWRESRKLALAEGALPEGALANDAKAAASVDAAESAANADGVESTAGTQGAETVAPSFEFKYPPKNLFVSNATTTAPTTGKRGAIFDLDGTLLDSIDMWKKIDMDFLGKRGFDVPEDYCVAIGHLGFTAIAEYTIQRFGLSDSVESVIEEWHDMARYEYANNISCKPGAREYLKGLRAQGVKTAIATALDKDLFETALRHNEIYDLFDAYTTIYDVNCGKGTPEVYVHAAEQMGLEVDDCVVFEDIVAGVKGAKAAQSKNPEQNGFTVVGIYDEGAKSIADEMSKLCDYFVRDFRDLI